MNTLDYIVQKFQLDVTGRLPITIYNINRTIMAQTLCELGFKVGAEIGVARGEHAETLCQNNPGLKLYCIDAWQQYHGYNDYKGKRLVQFYEDAKKRLAPYDCILIRKFSMEAVGDFEDGSLDFVYIDGAHDFLNVALDIAKWSRKVRLDGIVYGHDFKRSKNPRLKQHVVDVVQAWAYASEIRPWFVLGTKGKRDGTEFREGTQSWMWVKC